MLDKEYSMTGGRAYSRLSEKPFNRKSTGGHKFAIGQLVQFFMLRGPLLAKAKEKIAAGGNDFEVVRLLPDEGSGFQYRIKSVNSGQERVVNENEINLLTTP